MKKIVILDNACATQGNLDFEILKRYGDVIEYPRTPPEIAAERIGDAEIVITNKVKITPEIIDSCPSLRFISVLATGYNIIDTDYAREKGIIVSNVPSYSTDSVVQHTFALLLDIACGIDNHNKAVKNGEWANAPDFCLYLNNTFELSGKTLGIIGCGAIGKKVATVAEAFGMKVLIYSRTPKPGYSDKATVFSQSDVISVHCPLNDASRNLINAEAINAMKDGVIIINTARGEIVDEQAVTEGLQSGKIAYYAADVLRKEPPESDNQLIRQKNCIITSHVAWATTEARKRLIEITSDNVKAYIEGKPINVVND